MSKNWNEHLNDHLQEIVNKDYGQYTAADDWCRKIGKCIIHKDDQTIEYKFYNERVHPNPNQHSNKVKTQEEVIQCYYDTHNADSLKTIWKEIGLSKDDAILDFLMKKCHQGGMFSLCYSSISADQKIGDKFKPGYLGDYLLIPSGRFDDMPTIEFTPAQDHLLIKTTFPLQNFTCMNLNCEDPYTNSNRISIKFNKPCDITATIKVSNNCGQIKAEIVPDNKKVDKQEKIKFSLTCKKLTETEQQLNIFSFKNNFSSQIELSDGTQQELYVEAGSTIEINVENAHLLFEGDNATKNHDDLLTMLSEIDRIIQLEKLKSEKAKSKASNEIKKSQSAIPIALATTCAIISASALCIHMFEQSNIIKTDIFSHLLPTGKHFQSAGSITMTTSLAALALISIVATVYSINTKLNDPKAQELNKLSHHK